MLCGVLVTGVVLISPVSEVRVLPPPPSLRPPNPPKPDLSAADVGRGVLGVGAPVFRVAGGQGVIPDDEEILGILPLRGRGEVEGSRDDRLAVDDHDLVVGDGVPAVDQGGDARMGEEVRRGILGARLLAIQDHLHVDAATVGRGEGAGDGRGGEGVGQHAHRGARRLQRFHHRRGRPMIRREIHVPAGSRRLTRDSNGRPEDGDEEGRDQEPARAASGNGAHRRREYPRGYRPGPSFGSRRPKLGGGRERSGTIRGTVDDVTMAKTTTSSETEEAGMSDEILVERGGGIATVIFNRPKMRNAVSLAMWGEIANVTETLSRDDAVRAVVYRGAGRDAFASGADISEFKENRKDTETALAYNKKTEAAYTAIRLCPKPTVAMVFGFCMGGAMALAMACDLRFAAGGSKFGIPAAKLSIIYGLDPVHQLVDLVGPAYAKDILYSGRTLDAPEALRIGFIQRLLPPSELEAYTYDYLRTVADNAPLSIRGTKAQVQAIFEGVNETHRRKLFDMGIETFNSQDYAEGTRAFLEKRKPVFKGK